MDEQIVELMRDRFDLIDRKLDGINDTIAAHVDKDETYWKKIDKAEGQISLMKWVGSSISISGALAWLFNKFGQH